MTSLMAVIVRITTGTPAIEPKTAIGALMGICIMPSLAPVGSIWHKRP
jgi:hypothetical protein